MNNLITFITNNSFNIIMPIIIAFAAIILVMIITKYVIFIGMILSKTYSEVKIDIKPQLIILFILITIICYGFLNH